MFGTLSPTILIIQNHVSDTVRSVRLSPSGFTRKTTLAALAGAFGYTLVLLATAYWAYSTALFELLGALLSIQVGPWLWWGFLGGAVVGAVLTISIVRYGLVSPLVSMGLVYGVAMYQMWQVLQDPYPYLPGTPLDLYFIGWPVLLVVALGSGLIERHLRAGNIARENKKTM